MDQPHKQSYGEVILKKGTRLVQCSLTPQSSLPDSVLLRLVLHPSEGLLRHPNEEFYSDVQSYVTTVELVQDVSLFFMIEKLTPYMIRSSFSSHTGLPYAPPNLTDIHSTTWLTHLAKEGFHGWLTVRDRYVLEVGLRNDSTLLRFIECSPLQATWRNATVDDTQTVIPKRWGTRYPISTDLLPATCHLNRRFEAQIQIVLDVNQNEDPGGTACIRFLEAATLYYRDAPVQQIRWTDENQQHQVGDGG